MATEKELKKEKNAIALLKMISEDQPESKHDWVDNQFYLRPVLKAETPKLQSVARIQQISKQKRHYEIFKKRTQRKFHLCIPENRSKQPNYKSFSLSKLQRQYDVKNSDSKTEFRIQNKKLNLKKYKEKDSNLFKPMQKQKKMNQTVSGYLRPSGSQGYILKINKFVTPQKLNQLSEKSQRSESPLQKIDNVKQGFRSKVRWKISSKFAHRKQSTQQNEQKRKYKISTLGSEQNLRVKQDEDDIQKNKGLILKNLLYSNRYQKRKSVASLLRSLFDSQAQSKKEEHMASLAIRSARFVSLTTNEISK